jgi:tetratricopeptide (TPR) repeat protein
LGNFGEAIRWLSESAEVCDRTGNRRLAGENLYMLAQSRHQRGDYDEAEVEAAQSIATLAEINDAWNSSFALVVAARIATTLGRFDKALEYAERGLSFARQVGVARSEVLNLQALSAVYRELEDHQGAWQIAREAVTLARVGEAGAFQMPLILSSCALIEAVLGQTAEAQAHIEEARRSLRPEQARAEYAHDLAHTEGRALLALRRPAEAVAAATVLMARIGASDDLHWRLPTMLLLADATSARGDPVTAVQMYETIAEEAHAARRTPVLWRALANQAESQRAVGQTEASVASARRALELINHLAATAPDGRLRTTFLQSAKAQRVAGLAGS